MSKDHEQPVETVDEFLARGGTIQRVDSTANRNHPDSGKRPFSAKSNGRFFRDKQLPTHGHRDDWQ